MLIVLALNSCDKERERTLSLGPEILALKPSGSDWTFSNANGDTIQLSLVRNDHSKENINPMGGLGNLDYDKVTAEKRHYTMRCDSPSFQFDYYFSSELSSSTAVGQVDALAINYTDEQGSFANNLTLTFESDVYLLDPNLVIYYDSLNLINKSYAEVFSPIQITGDSKHFYYQAQKGIVGFISSDSVVFERID